MTMVERTRFQALDRTARCRVRVGAHWQDEGRMGWYFGRFHDGERFWAIVRWDDEEDPDLHKALGIEVKTGGEWHISELDP